MYEKIYMHSGFEQKRNKIFGLKEYVCVFVMGIPFILLGIALFAFLNRPLSSKEFTIAFSAIFILWVIVVGLFIVSYLKDSSKVFAVSKNGKVYIMNMSKEAASYLSLNTAVQNMGKGNAGGKPNVEAIKAVGKVAADTFNNIEDSDIENRIEGVGLCIDNIDKVVIKKKKIVIYGKWGNKTKFIIPRMYNEVDELERYFVHMSEGYKGQFEFHKKTKEDVLNERIKKNPYKIFIKIFCVVLWLFVYNFANDLNRYAHIMHNYDEAVAIVEEIETDADETLLKISYKTEGASITNEISIKDTTISYNEGDKIDIYYNKSDAGEIVEASSVGFLIKPFIVLLVGFEGIALVIRLLSKKK